MTTSVSAITFFAGAAVSVSASWILVSRIERAGSRFHLSEALLGLVSALAADAPEITSAVTALIDHQGDIGAGVVVGSNVFNLAALIGLGAIIAGGISLLRRAVALQGVIAIWVALVCLGLLTGVVPPGVAVGLAAIVLAPYVLVSAVSHTRWWHRVRPLRLREWLDRAIAEEELEVGTALRAPPARPRDAFVGGGALVVVVVASVAMERAATRLGSTFHVPGIVVGGVVLAAVTSLPNAVAAIYWARRGRGAAALSTALNSNALNVAAGLLLPAAIIGIGAHTTGQLVAGAWYAGLTALTLVIAFGRRGVSRVGGWVIVGCYGAFLVAVLLLTS